MRHLCTKGNRIAHVREMIVAETKEKREKALAKLLPIQRGDFNAIFQGMGGRPVTIRLLDPPLHEFVPHGVWHSRSSAVFFFHKLLEVFFVPFLSLLDPVGPEAQELSKVLNVSLEKVKNRIDALKESNPMLGHRGCRLGITYPEIYDMQVRAIFEAACEVAPCFVFISFL